jgi:hypothetical protein
MRDRAAASASLGFKYRLQFHAFHWLTVLMCYVMLLKHSLVARVSNVVHMYIITTWKQIQKQIQQILSRSTPTSKYIQLLYIVNKIDQKSRKDAGYFLG